MMENCDFCEVFIVHRHSHLKVIRLTLRRQSYFQKHILQVRLSHEGLG